MAIGRPFSRPIFSPSKLSDMKPIRKTAYPTSLPSWKNKLVLSCFVLLFPAIIWGQNHRCYTMEHLQQLEKQYPELVQKRAQADQLMRQQSNQAKRSAKTFITIPVVFHVMHNGDAVGAGENISDAQILANIAQLNADYRRTNSDAGNTPLEFQDEAADLEIEFCLASIDPAGDPTTGIERINISTLGVVNTACWSSAYIDANIKVPTVWNNDLYLNIWTTEKIQKDDCDPGILGYAQFPDMGPENTDGVVVVSTSVGSIALPATGGSPYDMGRTLTHEVGHWVWLYHIWGDDGSSCTMGTDEVTDTPDHGGPNFGCPSHPNISCTVHEMFMNYMDYVDDNCMNMFTQGQLSRAHMAIDLFRPAIVNGLCGNCPANLTLSSTEPGTLSAGLVIFNADFGIVASNTITTGVVKVEYKAGESVNLATGFWAQRGSHFRAYIQDCDGSTRPGYVDVEREKSNSRTQNRASGMEVFPNPFHETFNIQFEVSKPGEVSVQLSDALGRLVGAAINQQLFEAGQHSIQMEYGQLPPGFYYLTLSTSDGQWAQKLVKGE